MKYWFYGHRIIRIQLTPLIWLPWVCAFIFTLFTTPAISQLTLVPVAKEPAKKVSTNLRTQQAELQLPFWDDFFYADSLLSPLDSLWQFSQSTWSNTGMGINPPSLGVVTFDGLDSLGKTYSVNDVLAKGFADKLVSQPIRLDLVDVSHRDSVYISFYVQWQGNGEPPDPGDQFTLSFKSDIGKWENVKVIDNDGTLERDAFYAFVVPVDGDRFFHDSFQFRFQNFGRLSGPFDTWNLDYVYLNIGRYPTDTSFPDRTITSPLTSLFKDYRAVPIKHFFNNPNASLNQPTYNIYNLKADNDQPLDHFSNATITNFKDGTPTAVTLQLDSAQDVGGSLPGLTRKTVTLTKIPPVSAYDADADSIEIEIRLRLFTKDNVPPILQGDYDQARYSPVDFRLNDKTRGNYVLSNYYAYDDGAAEYGAALNQPGSMLAYHFQMQTDEPDTIVAVDLYFPRFGDETAQSMQLQILRDLTGGPGSTLYTEPLTIERSENNKFWHHTLSRPVGVETEFFIAFKQNSFAVLAIGLDKNTNAGSNIYFNTNGTWAQNTLVNGSLMIRPVFGEGEGGLITGIPEEHKPSAAYPNPNSGVFYISTQVEQVEVLDLSGKSIPVYITPDGDRQKIEITQPSTGLYILKTFEQGRLFTQKLLVRP